MVDKVEEFLQAEDAAAERAVKAATKVALN